MNTVNRHTEEIQNIIGAPPSWLLNWGITIILGLLVAVLGFTQLIQYPEIVKTHLKLRSVNPDEPVDIKTSGRLMALLVKDNQFVQKGQELLVVEKDTGRFVLRAPSNGIINYQKIIHENQELPSEEILFRIHSSRRDFFGELAIPQYDRQKIQPGQEVLIMVRDFPSQDYGVLHGTIIYTAEEIIGKYGYLAAVDLRDNNLTDRRKSLPLKDGMDADAEIIVQKTSLLQRIKDDVLKKIFH